MTDKDYLDMRKYFDDISIDMNEFIRKNFLTPYELKIKSDAIFEELPLFKNIYTPRSTKWNLRVQEEYEIFNILKEKYIHSVGFYVFDNLKHESNNTRIWSADFYFSKGSKPMKLEIRLSILYPKQIPLVQRSEGDFHVSLAYKCFGKLIKRWRIDGRFGLAHFCTMIGYYYALERKSRPINI